MCLFFSVDMMATHLHGVQDPAEVYARVRLCHVGRVSDVQSHCHIPCMNSLLIHSFIL